MKRQAIAPSELILNEDGSVYHLNLLPEDIATNIIFVGDPERVPKVSQYFDSIRLKKTKREFVIHTGRLGNTELTVMSTGMGTDNIDIVMNELDALVNIDLSTKMIKDELTKLNIIRIGTSGALQAEIPVDSFLVSEYAVGLEGLMSFYHYEENNEENSISNCIIKCLSDLKIPITTTTCSSELLNSLAKDIYKGITLTNAGFYGPQGRVLRLPTKQQNFLDELAQRSVLNDRMITNLEMETSGIYGMGKLLGHHCISFNAILANRALGEFSKDTKAPVDKLIKTILERLS
ncbi:MAG: nucleoside phosphorylase [Chitinophagales bacterium]|nr:nucleoside phosphorylase [Chitinophagales bacterium]